MRLVVTGVQTTTESYTVQYNVLAGEPEQVVHNGTVSFEDLPTPAQFWVRVLANLKTKPAAYFHYVVGRTNQNLP